MLSVPEIADRLRGKVTELRSVQGAVELAALLKAGTPIVGRPFAHVIPTGLRGSKPTAAAGVFVQPIEMGFSVVLTIPTVDDPKGEKALPAAERLMPAVIEALAGWGPATAPGVVYLTRAQIQRFEPGLIIYGIEFAIGEQLRISP